MYRDSELDRYRGCLLGLAAGDALGTTLEFSRPGSFEAIDDMVGGGHFSLEPGMWTDDTSMALCLAESLIERQEFDPEDQMRRYVLWFEEGHLSSNGYCFDIGNHCPGSSQALHRNGGSIRWFNLSILSRKRLPDAARAGADVLRSVYRRRCGPQR